ncbi:MAG: hypothetical protein V2A53_05335, partial [bacterium]
MAKMLCKKIIGFIAIVVLLVGSGLSWSAQVTVTNHNAPALNVGINHQDVLVMDVTLSTGGAGGNLNAITFKNTGSADSTDIAMMELWVDGGSAGWDGDEADLGTIIWDAVNSDWVITGLNQACDGVRFFVTVDVSATPIDDRTLRLQIPLLSDPGTNGIYDSGDEGIFLDTVDDGPASPSTNSNNQTIHTLRSTDITDNSATAKYGAGWNDKLVLDFKLPDNDGVADTLNALTVRLNSAATAFRTDFSEVRLWADQNPPVFQGVGIDADLGIGTWDGVDSWVFSGLTRPIPAGVGQRFFVTVDIIANPSSDDATIIMEIPKLVDADNSGSYDTDDEGVFVASFHDGPNNSDFTPANHQSIHKRLKADFTDHTVDADFGPNNKDKVVFDLEIPNDDGAQETLNALTVRLSAGATALSSDFDEVRLWADAGAAGFQGGGIDTDLGPGTWDVGDSCWVFQPLSYSFTDAKKRFFITVDVIANPSDDLRTITMEIPTLSDAGNQGVFNTGDEGIFVDSAHDGPIDLDLTSGKSQIIKERETGDLTDSTVAKDIGSGWKKQVVLNFILPDNNDVADTLKALTVRLDGPATVWRTDFSEVRLWADQSPANIFDELLDTNLGIGTWDGVDSWVFSGLNQNIPIGDQRFFVTVDVIGDPHIDDATIIMEIPKLNDVDGDGVFDTGDKGIFVASSYEGPTDADFTPTNHQTIHKRSISDLWDQTIQANFSAGQKNCLVFDFTLPDSDGSADVLRAITLRLDSASTAYLADISKIELWADAGAVGFQGAGNDTDLGPGTWDGNSWVFSPLAQDLNSPSGKRFFVALDITANPHADNIDIVMEIPQLIDTGTTYGVFETGEEGIFVDSCHEGPTGSDFTSAKSQRIHARTSLEITDQTQASQFGPGRQNGLLFDFTIPANDGSLDTLQALTLKLAATATALRTDLSEVRLWLDQNPPEFQGVGVDTDLGIATLDVDSWVFNLSQTIIVPSQRFFVTGNIVANPSNDDVFILMEIPKLSDADYDGNFDTGDEGIFVFSNHDGLTDASLVAKGSQTLHERPKADITENTPSADFFPGSKNGLVLNFVLPDNDGATDTLQALTTRLDTVAGAALASDFSCVRLWTDNGNNTFEQGTDTNIGTGSYDGNSWVFSSLAQTITTSQRFFITVDVINNPSSDDAIIIMEIPTLSDSGEIGTWNTNDEGVFVASLHEGPTDLDLTPVNSQKIHKRLKGEITDSTASGDFYPGKKNALLLNF